jgi:hypothetical protein
MTTSSSSTTPKKKRRHARMTVPTLKLHQLLLGTPRLRPPPPPLMMMHPMRCKVIVVTEVPPIGCKMIVVMVETRLTQLRLPRQKGCLQGHALKNLRRNDSVLLHHKFFDKREWGWWCRGIASLTSFMPPAVFVSCFYLFRLSCGPFVVSL